MVDVAFVNLNSYVCLKHSRKRRTQFNRQTKQFSNTYFSVQLCVNKAEEVKCSSFKYQDRSFNISNQKKTYKNNCLFVNLTN